MDIMVDLETMATTPQAAIVSIGAVAFERGGTLPADIRHNTLNAHGFYQNVDLQSCIDLGLEIEGATVMWWLKRDDAARRALTEPAPIDVGSAIANFIRWSRQYVNGRTGSIWSHGADFDIPILKTIITRLAALDRQRNIATSYVAPWAWWNGEHTRSIYNEAGIKLPRADIRAGGHNAFYDACVQAEHIQQAFRILRARRGGKELVAAAALAEREESDL